MSRKAALLPLLAALVLAACSPSAGDVNDPADIPDVLIEHGFDATDTVALIEELDQVALADRSQQLIASVRYDELLVGAPDSEDLEPLPIPDDMFYLSVAPYIDGTHPCHFHSLTTCVGELQNELVRVTVTDLDTGKVVADATETTYDNGFLAVWVPRDIRATLEVEYDGKTASTEIATGPEDATCVTTLQLA